MYADEIFLIVESEKDLQQMLNSLAMWCHKWKIVVIDTSTEIIVHFGVKYKQNSKFKLETGQMSIQLASSSKYLEIILDENLNYTDCAQTLSSSAG